MKPVESLRRRATPVIEWALPYWTRGKAGRETPEDLFRLLYFRWLVALSFKVLGASWDVSWHFKWLRDDLTPPHLLNSVGTAIANQTLSTSVLLNQSYNFQLDGC
ncbi:hypothetical protein ACWCSH_49225 [Streptosporangium sp. NPDC001682]